MREVIYLFRHPLACSESIMNMEAFSHLVSQEKGKADECLSQVSGQIFILTCLCQIPTRVRVVFAMCRVSLAT